MAPSTEHWKLAGLSLEENSKVGVLSVVVPDGPLMIVVSGGVVSAGGGGGGAGVVTVKLRVAGVASALAAASMARTAKLWAPSLSALVVSGEEQEE